MKKGETSPGFTETDLALFYEIANSIHAIRDLDEMLASILRKIREVFHVEGASLALHDAEDNEFYFIHTLEEQRDGVHERKHGMRFPDHLGVAGWVLREQKPALVPDVSKDDRFFRGIDRMENFETRSMICVPLLTRKGFLGVLYALNKLKGIFTERDIRLLEIVSGTMAVAIENAQFYGEIRQYTRTLEQEALRLRSEVQDRFSLQGIVGSSAAMQKVFGLVEKVIDTTSTVLVQGETGTGKELFARAIHYSGPRKDKPFVAENCAALSETLLESELFGHVKGAFTGAVTDKKGLFELADGGTIFLDEIGEMSQGMQVKLLRVLQEGNLRPVGGSQHLKMDVRLIASTNRDLEEMVRNDLFREDLFFRIHIFPVTIPPLRERIEDIPMLVNHFLRKYAKKFGGGTVRCEPEALETLSEFNWPGNVRELENEVERAMTLAGTDRIIKQEHLSERIKALKETSLTMGRGPETIQQVTARIEQNMILRALRQTNGNRTRAARMLGLTRQGLLKKIARYGLQV